MCLHAELFILKLDVAQIPIFNFLFYKFDLPLKFIVILKKIFWTDDWPQLCLSVSFRGLVFTTNLLGFGSAKQAFISCKSFLSAYWSDVQTDVLTQRLNRKTLHCCVFCVFLIHHPHLPVNSLKMKLQLQLQLENVYSIRSVVFVRLLKTCKAKQTTKVNMILI